MILNRRKFLASALLTAIPVVALHAENPGVIPPEYKRLGSTFEMRTGVIVMDLETFDPIRLLEPVRVELRTFSHRGKVKTIEIVGLCRDIPVVEAENVMDDFAPGEPADAPLRGTFANGRFTRRVEAAGKCDRACLHHN